MPGVTSDEAVTPVRGGSARRHPDDRGSRARPHSGYAARPATTQTKHDEETED